MQPNSIRLCAIFHPSYIEHSGGHYFPLRTQHKANSRHFMNTHKFVPTHESMHINLLNVITLNLFPSLAHKELRTHNDLVGIRAAWILITSQGPTCTTGRRDANGVRNSATFFTIYT
ncbi:hypothetical protein L798_00583 [Zootermopsis nevadensis]|uniref:Uncharacterized protein n=1 Tax=Zootermopsis nevadensis TaxID=136037 RepID=A0A067QKP3_ZOONE|nr:hypothetical protein L798_00583 [Zootermopsis nevadensis]